MNYQLNVTVGDGKYTVLQDDSGRLTALRYGEPWRDCCGDGLVYTLGAEVQNLREELEASKSRVQELENSIKEYENKLSAVMPSDFKDWHQNSKAEWPEVAAWVISSQRERVSELEKELDLEKETTNLQHKLMTTAEKRGVDKASEELSLANKQIKKLEKAGDDMYNLLNNCDEACRWYKTKISY